MTAESTPQRRAPLPMLDTTGKPPSFFSKAIVWFFISAPSLLIIPAMITWWGISWLNAGLALGFIFFGLLGVTTSYHRYFTHGAFKAKRWLRIVLALWAALGTQGDVITWVADHRRHHAYSDKEGDPHSPWLFGTGPGAILKGFWHAHMGWLFNKDKTNAERFAPDLLKDKDIVLISRLFPVITVIQLALPAVIGGWVTGSWWGAATAFFWAGLVRVGLVHHITWSTNSICHMIGEQEYKSKDHAANVWWLAIPSMGESWHNYHHADPSSARHGVGRGEIDITARTIWIFEKFGWAWDVKWPSDQRIAKLKALSAEA